MDCSGAPRPAGWSSATSRRRPRRKPTNGSRAHWPTTRRHEMRATAARRLEWMAVRTTRQPEPEPDNLAACLSSPGGLELVVEMAHDLRSPLTSILFLAERSEEHTSELQSRLHLVCRLLLEKKKNNTAHVLQEHYHSYQTAS